MFAVLLNNFALLNPVQSYYLHARQYTTMHHFAMHSHITLKSLWYIEHNSALSHQVMSNEAHQCWIVFTWINTQPLLQYTSPTHCCSTSFSHIKQLPQWTTCTNRRHCITKSCSQLCMCSSTPCHWTIYCQVISSFFTWILIVTSTWIPILAKPLYKVPFTSTLARHLHILI